MKKTLVIVLALALVLAASLLTLTACSGKEWEGEYSYYAWNYGANGGAGGPGNTSKYGCKVRVTIQGDVITKVVVEEDTNDFYNVSAGWTSAYGPEYGFDDPGKTNWRLHGQEMADSFVGLTTSEVLKIKTYVSKNDVKGASVIPAGQPITNGSIETIKYLPPQVKAVIGSYGDFGYSAGATQSSGRLVLAIQDAILNSQGKTENPNLVEYDLGASYVGEYKYANPYNASKSYGCRVVITVLNGKITGVWVGGDSDDYTNLTATWPDKQIWIDGGDAMAQSFVGMTVDQIKAMNVVCKDNGEPDKDAENKITGINYVVGATQSSGRLILAIKDAVSKIPAAA